MIHITQSYKTLRTWVRGLWFNLQLAFDTDARIAVVICLLSLVIGLAPVVVAITTRDLINGLLPGHATTPVDAVVAFTLAYSALLMGRTVVLAYRGILADRMVAALSKHLMALPRRWVGLAPFESPEVSDKLSSVERFVGMRSMQLVTIFGQGMGAAFATIGTIVLLSQLDWRLAVLLVAILVPTTVWQSRDEMRAVARVQELAPDYRRLEYLLDLATNVGTAKEIRLHGAEAFLAEMYERHQGYILAHLRGLRLREGLRSLIVTLVGGLALGIMVWLGAVFAQTGLWSVGEMGMYFVIIIQGQRSLGQFVLFATYFAEVSVFLSLLAELSHVPTLPSGQEVIKSVESLDVSSASFQYHGRQAPAVDAANIHLQRGQLVVIVGENGAGKSSLVKLICRFYDPATGSVLVNGSDLRAFDPATFRHRIASAFQDIGRFPLSVEENVALGRRLPRTTMADAFQKAGLDEVVSSLPNGSQQMLGREWGGTELSGGQWQRIGIARAFAAEDADLVVLDEPNTFLDARAEAALFKNLVSFIRGQNRCGLVITHRLGPTHIADQILVMRDGRIVESGTHEQLLAMGGWYAHLWSLQAEQYGATASSVAEGGQNG